MENKKIILSGMRPTGRLHIGHIESVLEEWKKLQEDYESLYFIADWHALTTELDTKSIKENSIEMVKDWIAYGIDPAKSTIFLQSKIPDHAELHLIFSMLTNLGRLERVPSYKAQIQSIENTLNNHSKKEIHKSLSYGFLGYPVLQAADILIYKTDFVPVGEDQLPHIELTREIARMFNSQYGNVLKEPTAILSHVPKILGVDGRKMSKSYHNDINPEDSLETLAKKTKLMLSDPSRLRKTDFGNPNACRVFDLQKIYQPNNKESIYSDCQNARIGCVDCKLSLSKSIYEKYELFREKRNLLSDNDVIDIISNGNKKARNLARETLLQVKDVMNMDYLK